MGALKQHLRDNIPEFKTVSRRMRAAPEVGKTDCPALFIDEVSETIQQGSAGPQITTFNILLWVVIKNTNNPGDEPISGLNILLDKIDAALRPAPYQEYFTIGGVNRCQIDGVIDKDAGELAGIGMARIPLKILVP